MVGADALIAGRELSFDYVVARVHALDGALPRGHHTMGVFPTLQHHLLCPDLPRCVISSSCMYRVEVRNEVRGTWRRAVERW